MAHLHPINEKPDSTPLEDRGDIEDYIVFCSDYCHQLHCDNSGGSLIYEGWYGCQEISITEDCAQCGTRVYGIDTYVNGEYVNTQDNWNAITNQVREAGWWVDISDTTDERIKEEK